MPTQVEPEKKTELKIETRYYLAREHQLGGIEWVGFTYSREVARYWKSGRTETRYVDEVEVLLGYGDKLNFLNYTPSSDLERLRIWGPTVGCTFMLGGLWLTKEEKFWP